MEHELPGVAGELYDHFCTLPGMDTGLAVGPTFGFMDWASDGRCLIRAPHLGPLNDGNALWEPVEQGFALVGSNACVETAIIALNRALGAVELSKPDDWEWDPLGEEEVLCVPASGIVTAREWPQVDLPADIAEWARAMRGRTGRMVVRMNSTAYGRLTKVVYRWISEMDDLNEIHPRIRRWTNLAAYVAIGVDLDRPVITSDFLEVVEEIAIDDHESVLPRNPGPWVPRETPPLNPEIPRQ